MEEARDILHKFNAIDMRKDCCILYTNRALTYNKLGKGKKALYDCEMALALDKSSLNAMLYKAVALSLLGKNTDAKNMLEHALVEHPDCLYRITEYQKKLNLK
ncbi:small glutamine-rich tetratricopeptide repeat-containing protein alpha-like [Daktulosphaira vitifoliae]|uniref:small glutamine-rich tetratricopeptide repeat-containing protein alpha-like n=1 Tax=Daktulosphaira vitifoliae TaxID=58002 RepID=UPI0021AA1116|nr:small glutamine-rich tetratricopeptide repeat-containing protein alpha-like [Daktulosphaira vitifoliae]